MQVPYVVKDDGKHGRSLFATSPIPKGTQVWKATNYATFETSDQMTSFLRKLPHDVQCDVLLWAYPTTHHGRDVVALDMDEGSYMNHATSPDEWNVDGNTAVARRDIVPGEEILTNYTQFITFNKVGWFESIRAQAWDDDVVVQRTTDRHGTTKTTDYYITQGAPAQSLPSQQGTTSSSKYTVQLYDDDDDNDPPKVRTTTAARASVASMSSSSSLSRTQTAEGTPYDDVVLPLVTLCVVPILFLVRLKQQGRRGSRLQRFLPVVRSWRHKKDDDDDDNSVA
jgi:hypothetical protein